MKKLLPVAALTALLASCTPTQVAPAASVTGYWTGSVSKYGLSVNISAHIAVTDQPNTGDFTGNGNLSGLVTVDNATVTGNTKTGVLVATNGKDTVSCGGVFSNNNHYEGTCSYGSYSAPISLNRISD